MKGKPDWQKIFAKGISNIGLIPRVTFQFSSVAQLYRLCDPMDCSTPGFPVHHQLPELPQTHVHWVGDAIQPSHPLDHPLLLLPSIFPSIKIFSNESALRIRWTKHWSFSFSISPSNEYTALPKKINGWQFSTWKDALHYQLIGKCSLRPQEISLHIHCCLVAKLFLTLKTLQTVVPRGSSWPRDQTRVSCIGRQILYQ